MPFPILVLETGGCEQPTKPAGLFLGWQLCEMQRWNCGSSRCKACAIWEPDAFVRAVLSLVCHQVFFPRFLQVWHSCRIKECCCVTFPASSSNVTPSILAVCQKIFVSAWWHLLSELWGTGRQLGQLVLKAGWRWAAVPEGHGEQPGQGCGILQNQSKTRDHSPCTAAALPSLHPCIFTSSVSKQ